MSWQQLVVMFIDICIYNLGKVYMKSIPYVKFLFALVGYVLAAAGFSALASVMIRDFLI